MSKPSSLSTISSVATSNRVIGAILVLIGTVIIIVAISTAYDAFHNYQVPEIGGGTIEEILATLMSALVDLALRLGFLGVVVWAASILLKHGVNLLK